MKLDLVMWGRNCLKTLPYCLESIEKGIPHEVVGQKIFVDYHSHDLTPLFAEEYNWHVYQAPEKGIPSAANEGLRHVKSPYFASFESDVILSKEWFDKMVWWMTQPHVAIAQGIRVPTHPTLQKFDKYIYGKQKSKINDYGISIDNNIYDTETLRLLGGFPTSCPIAIDRELRDQVEGCGYKWVIDPSIISYHIRNSLWKTIKHDYYLLKNIKRKEELVTAERAMTTIKTPINALHIFWCTHDPTLIPYLFLHRLVRVLAILERRKEIEALKHEA